jgi:hypothetical protein
MKKGQISIQTIVVMIVALTVLVALILFFTGKFADLGSDIDAVQPDSLATTAECKLACDLAKSTNDPNLWSAKSEECISKGYDCEGLSAPAESSG